MSLTRLRRRALTTLVVVGVLLTTVVLGQQPARAETTFYPELYSLDAALNTANERVYIHYYGPQFSGSGTGGHICAAATWTTEAELWANCRAISHFLGDQTVAFLQADDVGKYLYLDYDDRYLSGPLGPILDGGTTGTEFFKISGGILVDGQRIQGTYTGPGPQRPLYAYLCTATTVVRNYDFDANCENRPTEYNGAWLTTVDYGKYLYFLYDDLLGTCYSSQGYGPITDGDTHSAGYFRVNSSLLVGDRFYGYYEGPGQNSGHPDIAGYLCGSGTWVRSLDVRANCGRIDHYRDTWYFRVLQPSDYGYYLYVVYNDDMGHEYTSSAYRITKILPVHSGDVTVSGPVVQGGLLTADPGSWGPSGVAVSGQWRHCDNAGDNCSDIAGATATSYTVGFAPTDGTLRYRTTGVFNGETIPVDSDPTRLIGSGQITLVNPPTLSGTARLGSTLTVSPGVYSSDLPNTVTYRWSRCAGTNCTTVPGAAGTDYALTADDVGYAIQLEETVTGAFDTATATTATAAPVAGTPAAWLTAGALTGGNVAGETVTYAPGTATGTGPLTANRHWDSCDDAGSCTPVPGADANTLSVTLTDDLVGRHVRVTATITNAWGSDDSEVSGTTVLAAPPSALTAPVLTGAPTDSLTLHASTGDWSGTGPFTYAYAWSRCDGAVCETIAGAVDADYRLSPADVGERMHVTVTATNTAGTASASSIATPPVAPLPPTGPLPTVSGTPRAGETLTASARSWSGTPQLTYAWRWLRCLDNACTAIPGADNASHQLDVTDVGATLVAQVTVTGPGGSETRDSARTGTVINAPGATLEREVSSDGQTITVTGQDFQPDSDVQVYLHSDPVFLGTAHTDANGAFAATFAVPAGTPAGNHHVVLHGTDVSGHPVNVEIAVTIAAPAPTAPGSPPASTQTAAPLPQTGFAGGRFVVIAMALIAAGAGLSRASRRSRRTLSARR